MREELTIGEKLEIKLYLNANQSKPADQRETCKTIAKRFADKFQKKVKRDLIWRLNKRSDMEDYASKKLLSPTRYLVIVFGHA